MSKNLNLVPKLIEGQKYNKDTGCLTLPGARVFSVEVITTAGLRKHAPKQLPPFNKLTQKEVFGMPDIDDRKRYVAAHTKREGDEANYEKEKAAFEQNITQELSTLSWCWQVVGNGMDNQILQHNTDYPVGMPKDNMMQFRFPELLVGGGFLWLEVFTKNDPALGITPSGLYVTATGTPQVVRIAWTDLDCKPINRQG